MTDPAVTRPPSEQPAKRHYQDTDQEQAMPSFRNVTSTSFGIARNRERMVAAIKEIRGEAGRHCPLVIGGASVATEETFDSVNPAKPSEVLGRVARASVRGRMFLM